MHNVTSMIGYVQVPIHQVPMITNLQYYTGINPLLTTATIYRQYDVWKLVWVVNFCRSMTYQNIAFIGSVGGIVMLVTR